MPKDDVKENVPASGENDAKKLREEKKKIKQDAKREIKEQKQEAKRKEKEIALKEAELSDDSEGSPVSAFFVTVMIVLVWLLILGAAIKLDIGGFGSNVLAPVLKDIPVLNKILPAYEVSETLKPEEYGGYTSLKEAVDQIKVLELQLEESKGTSTASTEQVAQLEAEIERLKTFESNQVEFQRIKTEFYNEVVYSDKGPGVDEYIKYYESMDPTTAEYLYKEAVAAKQETDEVKKYAQAYSEMKPKEAAGIFEAMTDNLDLAARILGVMEPDDRGAILGVMDPTIAAKITKIMNPES